MLATLLHCSDGVKWKHSECVRQKLLNVLPPWVLGFAKAWLHLRQRNAATYSPLCGERQRNAGCRATYTVTSEHSQRPRATREGRGPAEPAVKHYLPLLSVISCPSLLDSAHLLQLGCLNMAYHVEELLTSYVNNCLRLDIKCPIKCELVDQMSK